MIPRSAGCDEVTHYYPALRYIVTTLLHPINYYRPPVRPSRSYCFTINDKDNILEYQNVLDAFSKNPSTRYVVFQEERGENTGTKHYQGYVELKRAQRLSYMIKIIQGHYEARKGTREEARAYAMKEDTRIAGPWEFGEWSAGGQGSRNELAAAAAALKSGGIQAVLDDHLPEFIRHASGFERAAWRLGSAVIRATPPEVVLLYGPTGTGKTKWAYDNHPLLYRKTSEDTWFDGYEAQTTLLLDDFCGKASKVALSYLLCLLDRYPVTVPIKNSKRNMIASTIIVTTNIHPRLWYDYKSREEQYKALARRFTQIYYVATLHSYWRVSHTSFFDDWFEGCVESDVFIDHTQPIEDDQVPMDM